MARKAAQNKNTKSTPFAFYLAIVTMVSLGIWLARNDNPDKSTIKKDSPLQRSTKVYNWPPSAGKIPSLVPEDQRLRKNFYVILDGSGSMFESKCSGSQTKAEVAVTALQQFAQTLPKDVNLGLQIFDENGTNQRLALATNNRQEFNQQLKKMVVGGGTPLAQAMTEGLHALEDQARKQLGYGEYHLVVVTDGEADSDQGPETIVATVTQDTPVIIHTVGFCIGEDHSLNQPGLTIYKSAQSASELSEGLESVLAESESFDVNQFK